MDWMLVLALAGPVLSMLVVLETFRSAPLWPWPSRAPAPSQRRWIGVAILLVTSGNALILLADVGVAAFGLWLAGLALLIFGPGRRPTDAELDRRARLLEGKGD